jgi:hypothetical protein
MKIELSKSIEILVKALKEDEDYYRAWQANIAVCMSDVFNQTKNYDSLHDITNTGAKRFLDLLIRDVTNEDNN